MTATAGKFDGGRLACSYFPDFSAVASETLDTGSEKLRASPH